MRSYELAPGRARASADWSEATFPKPCAHGRRRHRDAESLELPNDALISPARVFSREPQDQLPNFWTNRQPAGTRGWRQSFSDQAPMPTEQRGRRDEERAPA